MRVTGSPQHEVSRLSHAPPGREGWPCHQGLPTDAYVASATVGNRNILVDGVELKGDTELNIAVRTPGATIEGVVSDLKGQKLSDAVVALVPDGPLRGAGPLYRSIITDVQGRYEIRGVAPGSYHLFAWTELEGSAFRNAEFMKEFDEKGEPVRIDRADQTLVNLRALN